MKFTLPLLLPPSLFSTLTPPSHCYRYSLSQISNLPLFISAHVFLPLQFACSQVLLGFLALSLSILVLQHLVIYVYLFDIMFRYLVTTLMGADLNNILKTQRLSDDHIQFLVYQILRALKVGLLAWGHCVAL